MKNFDLCNIEIPKREIAISRSRFSISQFHIKLLEIYRIILPGLVLSGNNITKQLECLQNINEQFYEGKLHWKFAKWKLLFWRIVGI